MTDETNLVRIQYGKVYVLGHPITDVIEWKAFYDLHHPPKEPHVHNSECCNRIDDHRFGFPHSCNGL